MRYDNEIIYKLLTFWNSKVVNNLMELNRYEREYTYLAKLYRKNCMHLKDFLILNKNVPFS